MKASCLIAAGGLGERFKESKKGLPSKLELPLQSKTLLETTLEPFVASKSIFEIIIAVPSRTLSKYRKRFGGIKKVKVVGGGATRTLSVHNALKAVHRQSRWVIVHDGARPLWDQTSLEGFLKRLQKRKSVIVASPIVPTVKQVRGGKITRTVPRSDLWGAQTPQGFEKATLKRAYQNLLKHPFEATDEASLVEAIGETIFLFKNPRPNPKITTFSDYQVVKKMMEGVGSMRAIRTGIGYDIHRLVLGRPLMLGGIRIPFPKGPLGHSDGDPVLHALSDALLGAAALGDIGDFFPDTSSKTKNMASSEILKKVYARVQQEGFRLVNADININLEKPKLATYKDKIKKRIASILKVETTQISLKARTNEGMDAVGEGKAVAAQATVLLQERSRV
jgi:2-C-methyl-D-erythritol 4-phosphate cytidylyltransferase/2-C-methyl-D-erythritol 2,4-cyclodiphosphate synthase